MAFSSCAIWILISGICAAAVWYWTLTCSTFICEIWPYLNLSSKYFSDSAVGIERALGNLELLVESAQLQIAAAERRRRDSG